VCSRLRCSVTDLQVHFAPVLGAASYGSHLNGAGLRPVGAGGLLCWPAIADPPLDYDSQPDD